MKKWLLKISKRAFHGRTLVEAVKESISRLVEAKNRPLADATGRLARHSYETMKLLFTVLS